VSLHKRGRKWWSYVWIEGVRHMKSTGTANRRLAGNIDGQFKEELNLRRHQMPQLNPEMTFGELFVRCLPNSRAKAWHVDRAKLLLPYFADIPIGRITKNMAWEYRIYRHKQKQVSDATINRDIGCLKHFLFMALEEGLLAANPLSRAPMVRERRKRRPVMSVEEEGMLLTFAPLHLKRIIIIALDTGMRRGEILQQRQQDIDWSRRLLFVSHSKTPEGEAREIPLTERLFYYLWEIRENEGPVFTFHGKPIHAFKTAWKTLLRRAGVRHYRFHDLRHTFNTRLMEAGVMQEVRKALMGHSSGEDVHSRYTHVELPLKREAICKLEAWLTSRIETRPLDTFLPPGDLPRPQTE